LALNIHETCRRFKDYLADVFSREMGERDWSKGAAYF
jgi:hypothetical protein